MPSISDTLHIASQAIENALTASSAQKIDPTTHPSGIHNHKKNAPALRQAGKKTSNKTEEDVINETENALAKHIDLRV